MLDKLTVTHLRDVVSRAHSVIIESDGADEHAELLGELHDLFMLADYSIGTSHMGCAADVVILERGDDAPRHNEAPTGYRLFSGSGPALNYTALTSQVADVLQRTECPAFAEHMGGNIQCVIVPEPTRLDHIWVFGTANETWGGDLCSVENGELIGETSNDTQHIVTDIPSDSTDAHAIAIDGIVQGLLAWRNAQ